MFNKIRNLFHDDTDAVQLEQKIPQTGAPKVQTMREIPQASATASRDLSEETTQYDGNLHAAFGYLQNYVLARLDNYFTPTANVEFPRTPQYDPSESSVFTTFIKQRQPDETQLIAVLLALVPQVYPNFLDALVQQKLPKGASDFMEFGGIRGTQHRGILPTGETLLYILTGNDFEARVELLKRIRHDSFFNQEHIVSIEAPKSGEPLMSGRLALEGELTEWLLTDTLAMPKPAERLALWQKLMPPQLGLAGDIDLTKIAYEHDLTGSNIINIIQHCSLNVLSQNQTEMSKSVLNDGIIREKIKISGA